MRSTKFQTLLFLSWFSFFMSIWKWLWKLQWSPSRGRFSKGLELGVVFHRDIHLRPMPMRSFSNVGPCALRHAPNFMKLTPGVALHFGSSFKLPLLSSEAQLMAPFNRKSLLGKKIVMKEFGESQLWHGSGWSICTYQTKFNKLVRYFGQPVFDLTVNSFNLI